MLGFFRVQCKLSLRSLVSVNDSVDQLQHDTTLKFLDSSGSLTLATVAAGSNFKLHFFGMFGPLVTGVMPLYCDFLANFDSLIGATSATVRVIVACAGRRLLAESNCQPKNHPLETIGSFRMQS